MTGRRKCPPFPVMILDPEWTLRRRIFTARAEVIMLRKAHGEPWRWVPWGSA